MAVAAAVDVAVASIVILTILAMGLTLITQEHKAPAQHSPLRALMVKLTLTQPVSLHPQNLNVHRELTLSTDGGYNAYLALWYQSLAQQQAAAAAGGQGDASKPPGTS